MKTKQNMAVVLAFALYLLPGTVSAASQDGYRVTAPPAFPLFNTGTPSSWAASNGASVVWSSGGSGIMTNGLWPVATSSIAPFQPIYRLVESVIGSPFEHIKPEYYLGDQVSTPANVDWAATYTLLTNSQAYANNAVFYEPSVPGIYFSEGGLVQINWVLTGGSVSTNSYQVSGSPQAKPFRIYWTDEPYNSPPVNLTGKYVKFFGSSDVLTLIYGPVTSTAGGMVSTSTNVVQGLFLDTITHSLQAIGGIEGRVVMAYYRTGSYAELLGVIVLEICSPDVKTVSGEIGEQLVPTGGGYDIIGLNAMVTAGLTGGDDVGTYVLQYNGAHSYSPNNGNLYAIRSTVGAPWNIEVYWQQADFMGTSWPFEVLQYECDWPADAEKYVRGQEEGTDGSVDYGLTISIPSAYTPTLMEYQDPPGHAILDNNTFSTQASGYSLLKLTGIDANGDDNIWFVPIQSIWRDDPLFDLTPGNWPIGREVAPLPTSIALQFDGTSASLETPVTNELSGSFTVEGFFQCDKPSGTRTLFYKNITTNNNLGTLDFQVEIVSDGRVRATVGTTNADAFAVWMMDSACVGFGDDVWHHIALVYNREATNATVYLDGVGTSYSFTGVRPMHHDGALCFGRGPVTNSEFFKGKIDDLRVWSRALSTNELQNGSAGFLHVAASEANLVAYYPVDQGLGHMVPDASGNGRDASMLNCVRVAPGAIGLSDMASFSASHAYIYEPVSGDNYNTNLYVRPDQLSSGDDTSAESDPTDTYIFAVNKTTDKPLEIWWSHEVSQAAMPMSICFPAWVQSYTFDWSTDPYSVPEIVLASQLGSANKSLVNRGVAVDFSFSDNSGMQVDPGAWFAGDNYTVECWVNLYSFSADGQVFNFNNGVSNNCVALMILTDGTFKYVVSSTTGLSVELAPVTTDALRIGWNHLALAVSDGTPTACLDGLAVELKPVVPVPMWLADVVTTNNVLGCSSQNGSMRGFDGQIDEFRIWNVARSTNEIYNSLLTVLAGTESGLSLYYPFDGDIGDTSQAEHADDRVSNVRATFTSASWALPGAPRLDTGVLMTDDAPFVYYQNDNTLPGYNPNEEHAFVSGSEGGYVTYALRCDLNIESSSESYVLVQYNDPTDGRPKMQVYQVVLTNNVYGTFAGNMTAGTLVPGPHPLDLLPDPWNMNTYWGAAPNINSPADPGYRDRKIQIWAKKAGMNGTTAALVMHNFYPLQDGFFFPSLALALKPQPALGTPVPWLCRVEADKNANVLAGTPIRWIWTVSWPTNCPSIDIGQTLTTAAQGLPEVWGAKSMQMIYESATSAVALYDPIVIQTQALDFEGDFASYFGFVSGPHGTIQQKNGLTYFMGVPPNVSYRFYFDPAAPKSACLKLAGQRVAPAGGLSYLQLNILSNVERTALKDLASNHTNEWSEAIEMLAQTRVDTDDSHAVVNYAMTHMGPGAGGYVTLLENDATNKVFGVNAGDPIQMHIVQLSSDLYTGALLPLQDPNDLLSEQLDILYTESFAGNGIDFEFQWKRAEPNADGTTPTDYDHQYSLYRDENGLTRFTIGKQGDTLPDMVNNFYVMRYKAVTNTIAYDATGGNWSGWVSPTLAEGWVQRVVNSVTPFTQRMQDLYDNPVETTGSMIQQAGAPYEGDVALNQDNLTSVGLIQLYQTVLNKAESMSLTLGINDTAANQQLMLAATRLNDLYMLLGNEAYADAMDPTIGFGSDYFDNDDFSMGGIDYGAMSSSLFCFDNLMPNLRDEELALLRGRSDQLAPSLELSPTYNRLYWNFTKGITAGEVAYAVNYQISGDAVTVDQPQAATLYPQGHGDAWGHYLSALNGYYRLMRNPYFSWGTPSITPMMVGDAVVDADYYDEEKFAESAAAMARTAVEVVKRSCEKSYVEAGGTPMAGYLDEDSKRAFGYGEWGARAGLSALYNWAAANALLPPYVDPLNYDFFCFATNTQLACTSPSGKVDFNQDFTIEFKVKPDASLQNGAEPCFLFDWHTDSGSRGDAGAISIALDPLSEQLVMQVQGADTNLNLSMGLPAFGVWSHVSITYSSFSNQMIFFLDGVPQSTYSSLVMSDTLMPTNAAIWLAANDSPTLFSGLLSEFRIWNVAREQTALVAARDGVSVTAAGLLMYQRFIADKEQGILPDDACGATWMAENAVWEAQKATGVALNFTDNSLLRLNRDSVGSLAEICTALKDVQRNVDLADAGMTPIGLSGDAIPFDIDPAALALGQSHFEQIAARAEQALANAATLLDRAQGISKLQRQQNQSASNTQQNLANEEAAFNTQLIGIFGYPYADDIGAGATYPQGYAGPDLYHYMWMDLTAYGFEDFELTTKKSVVYEVNGALMNENSSETLTLEFDLASNGMVLKPDSIEGSRSAQGSLQAAYGSFVQAYLAYRKALVSYDEAVAHCKVVTGAAIAQVVVNSGLEVYNAGMQISESLEYSVQAAALREHFNSLLTQFSIKKGLDTSRYSVPGLAIAGMAVGVDIGAPIKGGQEMISLPVQCEAEAAVQLAKYQFAISENKKKRVAGLYQLLKDAAETSFESTKLIMESEKLVMEVNDLAMALDVANATLINAQESCNSVLAKGEIVLSKRERLRKQSVNRIAAGRYQDMAFRTFRSDALAKYGNAFDLAKKYTYLATKAYDYETALGMSSDNTSDTLFREVVGTRTIGFMDDQGEAQLGGLHGDGGLADILARLKANWLVLKGRLGINNPQTESCWLSLRSECFRIKSTGSEAAKAWQDKLSSFRVDNLLDNPDFRRYCLPFQSSTGLLSQEPGLVIPFATSIDFARNVFGWPLAGNDNAFDSSYYATKISKMGVTFIGYNTTTNGIVALGNEPRIYLIPVGYDVMRSPGINGGELLAYHVVDQVVPVPFPLGNSSLDDPDWTAIYNSYTGNGDPMASIRRYPSLRAYHDHGAFNVDDMLSNTRLVGRSVWNTRWLLIIPAGTLNFDRDFALDTLIRGADLNRDGKLDQPGIQDIQIGFQTYSNSGN